MKTNKKKKSNEVKQRGSKYNRQGLYAKLEPHVPRAVEALVELLESRNDAIRLGAIKTILDKCIPDVKAMEITGEDKGPIVIKIIAEDGNKFTDSELPKAAVNL